MQLIQRISGARSKYGMSGLSEQAISMILGRDGLVEEDIRFLAIEHGKIFFDVPEQDWSADTNQVRYEGLGLTSLRREREIYGALEQIGEEYDMQAQTSNIGFSMNWLNDAEKALSAHYALRRMGCRSGEEGDFDEKAVKKEARRIEIARIHPRYLVFNDGQVHFAGLDSYQDRDVFLDKVVQAAYRQG